MKVFLLKLVTNPTVRKAFVGFVLAVLAAAGFSFGSGCGSAALPPAVAKARAQLECQLAVLEQVVPLSAAEDLVMAARAGNIEYVVKQLLALGLTIEDIQGVADGFNGCNPASAPSETPDAAAPALTRS